MGDDYKLINDVSTAESCQAHCDGDDKCKSFTWIKDTNHPGYKACHLKKSERPNPKRETCCDSGLSCLGMFQGEIICVIYLTYYFNFIY